MDEPFASKPGFPPLSDNLFHDFHERKTGLKPWGDIMTSRIVSQFHPQNPGTAPGEQNLDHGIMASPQSCARHVLNVIQVWQRSNSASEVCVYRWKAPRTQSLKLAFRDSILQPFTSILCKDKVQQFHVCVFSIWNWYDCTSQQVNMVYWQVRNQTCLIRFQVCTSVGIRL